jgi:hypothetical protein
VWNGSTRMFLIAVKCAVSLSSFVKRSEMLSFPPMCLIVTILFCTASRTAFSRIWIYLSPFVVILWDHATHAALSLYMVSGLLRYSLPSSSSLRRLRRYRMCLTHSSVAYISASAELRAVTVCLLDIQCKGPLVQMMYPEIDRDLNSSSSLCVDVLDWSCGPQFASVKGVVAFGSTGNFTNDSIELFLLLWNAIPRFLVPLSVLR